MKKLILGLALTLGTISSVAMAKTKVVSGEEAITAMQQGLLDPRDRPTFEADNCSIEVTYRDHQAEVTATDGKKTLTVSILGDKKYVLQRADAGDDTKTVISSGKESISMIVGGDAFYEVTVKKGSEEIDCEQDM